MNPLPSTPQARHTSTQAPRFARITGTGSHLPPRRLSNADMTALLAERGLETSDEWIVARTGIRARHFADDGVNSSDLALHACRAALLSAGRKAEDVDLIIVATSTPDMVFPSTACILQHKLGVHGCPAFDVQAVCSGFVYALTVADAMIKSGSASCALVVGAEVFSRILDFNDRTPACSSATVPARWCWKPVPSLASWPPNCTPMAAMSASCACRARWPVATCSGTRC